MCSVEHMKNPILKRYKSRAPRIPDFTCPEIDAIIDRLSSLKLPLREYHWLRRRMEAIRRKNSLLRDGGEYWYDIVKSWLK